MNNAQSSADALEAMRQAALEILPARIPRAVVVYGSFGRMLQRTTSDVDVLFVGETGPESLDKLTSALIDYSRGQGLTLDEEVPYRNKLLVDWEELTDASSCAVFSGSPRLIPVRRHLDFLASQYMRLRLFVTGVLAQRTLSWSEDPIRLDALRARARAGLVTAAADDLRELGVAVDEDSLVEYLIGQGVSSSAWLGFEPDIDTRRYLRTIVERTLVTGLRAERPNAASGQ
jgi:predicted nucleotidyltransferase